MILTRLFLSFFIFFHTTISIFSTPTTSGPINNLPDGSTGKFIYHEKGFVAFKITSKNPKEQAKYIGSITTANICSANSPLKGFHKNYNKPPKKFDHGVSYSNDKDFWLDVLNEAKKIPAFKVLSNCSKTPDKDHLASKDAEIASYKEALKLKKKQLFYIQQAAIEAKILNNPKDESADYAKNKNEQFKKSLQSCFNDKLKDYVSKDFLEKTTDKLANLEKARQNLDKLIEKQDLFIKNFLKSKNDELDNTELQNNFEKHKNLGISIHNKERNLINSILKEKCIAKKKLAEEFKKSLDSRANGNILSDSEIKKLAEKFSAAGNSLLTKAINDSAAASQEFKDSLNNPLTPSPLKSLNPSMTEEESEEFLDDSEEEDFFEDDSDNLPEDSDEESDEEDDQNKNNPSVTPGKPKTTENADSKDKETEDPNKSTDSDSNIEDPKKPNDTYQKDSKIQDPTENNPTDTKPKPEPKSNLAKIGKGCGYALLILACCWGIKKLHSLALESKDSKKEDSKKNTNKDKNVSQDSEEVEDE